MKKVNLILVMCGIFFISPLKAFVGFGVYGDVDKFLYPETNDPSVSLVYNLQTESFNNAIGGGVFVYIDALPFIDLEANIELAGNDYVFSTYIEEIQLYDEKVVWGRASGYLTARKSIKKTGIPFLAKIKLYAGGGLNSHIVTPMVTKDMIESVFVDEGNPYEIDFSDEAKKERLIEYIKENKIKTNGVHLQAGLQMKVLVLNLFVNARYTFAKKVIPNKNGFPSIWVGFAFGF